ncbi:MAG: D-cysteine desulfhydrase family protein [Defluviitaleaceae bacterium]|nr:D-cysteine desulfhydrase family protein [Defluviitaleaceae bacterium]
MNLNIKPRRKYVNCGVTPIERLHKLSELLGVNFYIKRDDLLAGLAMGGSKIRKLEFLMGDAVANGADAIITCGAVQSNHARLTLAACIREGLPCHLVLEERVPGSYDRTAGGNNLLYDLLEPTSKTVVETGVDLMQTMQGIAANFRESGKYKNPIIFPVGGSGELGALGYASCSAEITWQLHNMGLNMDAAFVTSGSGGTHSGLLMGLRALNNPVAVHGISISRRLPEQQPLIKRIAEATAKNLGIAPPMSEDIIIHDDYLGGGYSMPTEGMVAAVRLLAKTEGIILDPVYTGKAMDGCLSLIKNGTIKQGSNVLFIHTGGTPGLFAYKDFFFDDLIIDSKEIGWHKSGSA